MLAIILDWKMTMPDISPTIAESLTTREQQLLRDCEETIAAGLDAFVAVANALKTIRDQRLYRANYPTFEEYCIEKWNMSRQHAYRLIKAKSVVDHFSSSEVVPNERQARLLLKVPEEMWHEVWQEAISSASRGRISHRHLEAIVRRITPTAKPRNFGDPLSFRGLRYAPINEQGVVFLFGMIARELNFVVESVHNPFPDCIAKRLVDGRRRHWREVKIEFEFQSLNFSLTDIQAIVT